MVSHSALHLVGRTWMAAIYRGLREEHPSNSWRSVFLEGPMKLLPTSAALLAAIALFVNPPAVAQDNGKTAAAELTAESQKAWPQ